MDNFLKTEKLYTISELNNTIRKLIRNEFPDYIWVCGEIQDLRKDKKHIYFNLVQKHPEADQIIAQVKSIIFEDSKLFIFKRLKEADSAFELKDDIEVKLLCKVDLYPKWGEYRLIVVDVDPIYTLGKVAQNRQRIIEDLKRRGLLDKNKILPLPILPLNIGLITSLGSAAYYDFINELKTSGYGFNVFIYNSYMQGKFVERDVVSALELFNNFEENLDVIVITRGGGSTADLSWFDNERIAEAIAKSRLPVISGLGHQINTTITDLVAHTSLKTPTKVAQFLIEVVRGFLEEIKYLKEEILNEVSLMIEREKKGLRSLAVGLDSAIVKYFRDHLTQLAEKRRDCLDFSQYFLASRKRELFQRWELIKTYLTNLLKRETQKLDHLREKISLLEPSNILKRGFSITLKNKKVVKDASSLTFGDTIETIFFKGRTFSRVEKIGDSDEEKD